MNPDSFTHPGPPPEIIPPQNIPEPTHDSVLNTEKALPTVMHIEPQSALVAVYAGLSPDADLIEAWLRGRALLTIKRYGEVWREFVRVTGIHSLSEITLKHLNVYQGAIEHFKPATRRTHLAALRSLLRYAVEAGKIHQSVLLGVRVGGEKRDLTKRYLTQDQVRAMIACGGSPRNKLIIKTLYLAGLRVAEFCSLKWSSIAAQKGGANLVVQGKGGVYRSIQIPETLWQEISHYKDELTRAEEGNPSPDGKMFPLSTNMVWKIVSRAAASAGIGAKVSPHWLRHAHASHAIENGADLQLIRGTLGHRSIATTSAYLHSRPGVSSSAFLAELVG